MHIPLYKPFWGKKAEAAVVRAMRTGSGVADGPYSQEMRTKLKKLTAAKFCLPTTSCTHAMEAAVACLGAKAGDEVIVPSFTLSATATAAMIRGAQPVFADIDPVTYCLDPVDVERVITKRTVGIITVHYAGMAGPNFDKLLKLATEYKLWVVEDAAHCIGSYYMGASRRMPFAAHPSSAGYPRVAGAGGPPRRGPRLSGILGGKSPTGPAEKFLRVTGFEKAHAAAPQFGRHLGTFGAAGAFSFHGTKNVACGEGGAVVTDDAHLADKIEVFRAIGTDRQAFLQGKVSLYQWVGEGSSYLLSDLLAALVNIQLDNIRKINDYNIHIASQYTKAFQPYATAIQLPVVPKGMTRPNWHIYALKFRTKDERQIFFDKMRAKDIGVSTHYVPLHAAPMGRKISARFRRLPVTEEVAETLIRLPIYGRMTERELDYVITTAIEVLKAI